MLNNRRRRRNQTSSSSKTAQLMNLSLFIMLLAFFIVLNSISSYESNLVGDVVESLEVTFSKDVQKRDVSFSVRDDQVKSINDGDTFDRLDALFQTQISTYQKTISSNRGIMTIKLPYEKFEKAVMAAGQRDLTKESLVRNPRGNFMVPTLVSLLRSDQKGSSYRMNILAQVSDNPANLLNQNPGLMQRRMNNVSRLAQKLEEGGIPQKLLNVGLKKGRPEIIELVFEIHKPFSLAEEEENNG
ncbi:MAG: hypothetical protein AAF988_02575 [Pseudomonadota bacterium]